MNNDHCIAPIRISSATLSTVPDPNLTRLFRTVREWDQRESADVGLLGIPFDGAVVNGRQGARLGPKGVRDALYENTSFSTEFEVDLSTLKLVDCGDVLVDNMNYQETYKAVEIATAYVLDHKIIPIIVGGDHSITSSTISAFCKSIHGGKVGVIDVDTHYDCRYGKKPQSGYWVREILDLEGSPISGENLVQIGIHGNYYSPHYHDYTKKNGIRVFTPKEVRKVGMQEIIDEALAVASKGTDAIYVSVDIDAADIAYAPGTESPSPGGMDTLEMLAAAVNVGKNPKVRAIDLMEIAPPLDHNNMTSKLGAEILLYFLCGYALRKS